MMKEFKAFIAKGNVIDLAVGLIMATYFGAIVKSLVDNIIMPPIGKLINGVDFKNLEYVIDEGTLNPETGEVLGKIAIGYGAFINAIITFIIVAFAVFMVVKGYNRLKKKEEEKPSEPPKPTKEEELLTEIRDLLKAKQG
ncbi:large-conductance mechanosensitive channel protein MscL [Paracrocinitomix mangrovi]|uniref:large-conductance mechanosensitive channel protein MscL n=1 Tax=Paracrocinitomix mangrovi TaxID=2862509 RepID=UPI001C8E7BE3|nr:large-conductance mechanosensitive channel protein MscL [Paracrocinitomix mangrovi]UKN00084.1 large-conductance mechanosensitive channel protein MscL [Paracrocinitomix mangrovi]